MVETIKSTEIEETIELIPLYEQKKSGNGIIKLKMNLSNVFKNLKHGIMRVGNEIQFPLDNSLIPLLKEVDKENDIIIKNGIYHLTKASETGLYPSTKHEIIVKVGEAGDGGGGDTFLIIIGSNGCLFIESGVNVSISLKPLSSTPVYIVKPNGFYTNLLRDKQLINLLSGVHFMLFGRNCVVIMIGSGGFNSEKLITTSYKQMKGVLVTEVESQQIPEIDQVTEIKAFSPEDKPKIEIFREKEKETETESMKIENELKKIIQTKKTEDNNVVTSSQDHHVAPMISLISSEAESTEESTPPISPAPSPSKEVSPRSPDDYKLEDYLKPKQQLELAKEQLRVNEELELKTEDNSPSPQASLRSPETTSLMSLSGKSEVLEGFKSIEEPNKQDMSLREVEHIKRISPPDQSQTAVSVKSEETKKDFEGSLLVTIIPNEEGETIIKLKYKN